MRPSYLIVATTIAIGASVPVSADTRDARGVFVPMNHGITGRAYPPVWATPSGRTCQRVSTPSDGWICVAGPPSQRLGRFGDPSFDRSATGAKPAKARQAKAKKTYAAKPKAAKQSAKTVKRASPGRG